MKVLHLKSFTTKVQDITEGICSLEKLALTDILFDM